MHKTILTIDGFNPAYLGYYIPNKNWNGWEFAHFEFSEAIKIAEEFNKNADYPMTYDPIYDQFYVWEEANKDYYIIKGEDHETDEGIKHLYGIGSGYWVWDRISKSQIRSIAQQIEEFIYYHDTYNYWDEYDIRREVMVDDFIRQFRNLDALAQAINIMWDERIKADEKYTKLGGILRI